MENICSHSSGSMCGCPLCLKFLLTSHADLLAACENALPFMEEWMRFHSTATEKITTYPELRMVRAAIQKAKGGS